MSRIIVTKALLTAMAHERGTAAPGLVNTVRVGLPSASVSVWGILPVAVAMSTVGSEGKTRRSSSLRSKMMAPCFMLSTPGAALSRVVVSTMMSAVRSAEATARCDGTEAMTGRGSSRRASRRA